ncbi:MAG: class I SAM-dependent DNA methyltransferase [Phycisphaerae bacterium]|nr:class I SAM-dependent DNA methyltransferase [Phycisphaerae bacterium]
MPIPVPLDESADIGQNTGMPEVMTPAQFVAKWSRTELSERAASQEHFLDLCRLLGQPTPAEHDATGAEYTFEKGVAVLGGASRGARGDYGYADVWWRGKFAWEYKRRGKYRDLTEAYRQLCQYREALENPPLLIVSDIERTEIHTNFTGTAKQVHTIHLSDMASPEALDLLRRVFTAPASFRPTLTPARVTEVIAGQFGTLATGLRARGHDPQVAAHFLMKCMFCLFAEDVGLLPASLFTRLLEQWRQRPAELVPRMSDLFAQMRTGGAFGVEAIPWFNGGLFDEAPALSLTEDELALLLTAARVDWGAVEPAIFGTLFERSLDPDTRAQIGAHYTSREDILLVVEPVVMAPLREEWEQVKADVATALQRRDTAKTKATATKARQVAEKRLQDFVERLASVRILDPACGSGNFLYVAIQRLLELEKEVITFAARPEISLGLFPHIRPTQLHGIEINPYAAELAQVVIWIGYLQWMRDNGFIAPSRPILEPIQSIQCRDAILAWEDEEGRPIPAWRAGARCRGPAAWSQADFIIGNPPFLGSKLFRQQGLEDDYIQAMYASFDLPNTSDLCCYWFESARQVIAAQPETRAGLLATQGIRGGDNRTVLQRIKETGDIFMAWSDREWILDGAAVHVSIVGFDSGLSGHRVLDGCPVEMINSDLSMSLDLTHAVRLPENLGVYVRSPEKGAKFEIPYETARDLLRQPNPNGRSTFEVVRPWINGQDLVGGRATHWILDFHDCLSASEAAGFQAAFEVATSRVYEDRKTNRDARVRENWWRHRRAGDGVRCAARRLSRLLGTTMVSKFRLFRWIDSTVQPDKTIPVFARSDDYFLGVLHNSIHELWARRRGTQLREVESGFRYTPTTCFETFPLPWAPGAEPVGDAVCERIGAAAKQLNEQRERWLNPPEWIEPIASGVDAADDFADVPAEARPLIRESAILAAAASDPRLKKRTLTNLYNERPTWLRLAHEALDRAVLAAYAVVDPEGEWAEDWAELWSETGAGQPLPEGHEGTDRRKQIEQQVFANLLRLNLSRAAAR